MQEKISAISLARLERKSLTDAVNEVEENLIDGKKFKSIRRKMVLTQQELAEKIGMSLSGLRRVEREQSSRLGPKYIRALAELQGIAPSQQLAELSPVVSKDGRNGAIASSPPTMTYNPTPGEAVVLKDLDSVELVKLARRAVHELLERQKKHPTMMGAKDQLKTTEEFLEAMRIDLERRKAKRA